MKRERIEYAIGTSRLAAVLAAALSLAGTFQNGFYRDNAFVKSVWLGNDIVTWALAIPLLFYGLHGVHASMRKRRDVAEWPLLRLFLWLGGLSYLIYNYVFYVYGAAFSGFFLGQVLVVALSVIALLQALTSAPIHALVATHLSPPRAPKRVQSFLLIFAGLLGAAWIAMAGSYWVTGEDPEAIRQTGHPTGVVFATDLLFLVLPLFSLSVLLRRGERWAWLFVPILLVKCSLYPVVFVVAGITSWLAAGTYDVLTPAYLLMGIGSAWTLTRFRVEGADRHEGADSQRKL